jgi:hypothetical protein
VIIIAAVPRLECGSSTALSTHSGVQTRHAETVACATSALSCSLTVDDLQRVSQ